VQAHTLGKVAIIGNSFAKGLFQDSHSNSYWNWFVFERRRAKDKL